MGYAARVFRGDMSLLGTYMKSTTYIPSCSVLGIGSWEDCFPNRCNTVLTTTKFAITF